MAKSRRNAQIGLLSAVLVMVLCLGVLASQGGSADAKAKSPQAPVTSTAVQGEPIP